MSDQKTPNPFARVEDDTRECPECGFESLKGMPGGRDAVCGNCGYKDPCCYD